MFKPAVLLASAAVMVVLSVNARGQNLKAETPASLPIAKLSDGSCELHVRVVDAQRHPVQRARVAFLNKADSTVAVMTNEEGRAQFLGLRNTGRLDFLVSQGKERKTLQVATPEACGKFREVVLGQ